MAHDVDSKMHREHQTTVHTHTCITDLCDPPTPRAPTACFASLWHDKAELGVWILLAEDPHVSHVTPATGDEDEGNQGCTGQTRGEECVCVSGLVVIF